MRGLRSPRDVERDGLVRVAAEAAHFEIEVACIEGIAERGRRLRGAAIAEHALVPRLIRARQCRVSPNKWRIVDAKGWIRARS